MTLSPIAEPTPILPGVVQPATAGAPPAPVASFADPACVNAGVVDQPAGGDFRTSPAVICTTDGCDGKRWATGLCQRCYQRGYQRRRRELAQHRDESGPWEKLVWFADRERILQRDELAELLAKHRDGTLDEVAP